jgi:hypothetical protein
MLLVPDDTSSSGPGAASDDWLPRLRDTAGARGPRGCHSLRPAGDTKRLTANIEVRVSPGVGFGDYGDTHLRFALIESEAAYPAGGARHPNHVHADGSMAVLT